MSLDAVFKKIQKSSTIFRINDAYLCFFEGGQLLERLSYLDLLAKKPCISEIEKVFRAALPMIRAYYFSEEKAEERRLKGKTLETDILLYLARILNHPCYAMNDGKVCVSALYPSFASDFFALQKLFEKELHVSLVVQKVNSQDCYSTLREHIEATKVFFLDEHGPWIESFMGNLGDEVSRISLACYLRQRVMAQVFDNSPICYPAQPPRETEYWRNQRQAQNYDFPTLHGVKDPSLFYLCAYIYEQYAIPDVVEAMPGDVVIDAGAYIGDTACYFSRKVGDAGKIYSFEIVAESANFLKENVKINHCSNVEIVPYALADLDGDLLLNENDTSPSTAFVAEREREREKQRAGREIRFVL